METLYLRTFEEFHDVIWNARSGIYRGVKSCKFHLTPKVGRVRHGTSTYSAMSERKILKTFKNYSVPFPRISAEKRRYPT